jgi:DNA repair exonuclease SbcCD ATPase subunit
MGIKDLLAKIVAGEALTDAERAEVKDYDPESAVNSAAAAARRASEAKLAQIESARAALAAKLAETESQSTTKELSMADQLKALNTRLASIEAARVEAENQTKALKRAQSIEKVRNQVGINFVPGIDHEYAAEAFERAFKDIEVINPEDEAVKTALTAWTTKNKALILDTTGSGSGQKTSPATLSVAGAGTDVSKMSDQELLAHMKSKKLI